MKASEATRANDEVRALMRAGYQLIATNPGEPITLKDLLAAAQLSTRAFYRHFETKDQLLVAIYKQDAARFGGELQQRMADATSAQAAISLWIEHWVSAAFDVRRSRRINVLGSTPFAKAEGMREVVADSYAASIAALRDVFARGQAAGAFPTSSPDFDARALQMATLELLHARVEGRLASSPDQTRAALLDFARRLTGSPLSESSR